MIETTKTDRCPPLVGGDWTDPLEDGVRSRVRAFIETTLEEQLEAALRRDRYERKSEGPNGYRGRGWRPGDRSHLRPADGPRAPGPDRSVEWPAPRRDRRRPRAAGQDPRAARKRALRAADLELLNRGSACRRKRSQSDRATESVRDSHRGVSCGTMHSRTRPLSDALRRSARNALGMRGEQ